MAKNPASRLFAAYAPQEADPPAALGRIGRPDDVQSRTLQRVTRHRSLQIGIAAVGLVAGAALVLAAIALHKVAVGVADRAHAQAQANAAAIDTLRAYNTARAEVMVVDPKEGTVTLPGTTAGADTILLNPNNGQISIGTRTL